MADAIATELTAAGFADADEIGRGGVGIVYRCTQVNLNRVVAVKVLLPVQLDEYRERFVREQHAMARLTGHPNIVAVLQIGETESGHPFLVMPYCGHGCLQTRISRMGSLPLDEVLRLGVKVAGAVESAHRLGVVHRDIKPGNILLTDYGEPALCDFGIARIPGGFETGSDILMGSPAFTAPEVIGGDEPQPAGDVYGLGASLFSALTGHAAFERHSGEQVVAQFLRVASEPVPDLSKRGIPEDIAAIVNGAMSRGPDDRPTALALGELLQEAQSRRGLPVDAMALHGSDRPQQHGVSPSVVAAPARRTGGRRLSLRTTFVGRTAELEALREMLSTSQLVTLTGTGGVGKTALATQAAAKLLAQFPDGVWLVELGDLREGSLLIEVVAAALGVRDQSGRPLIDVLVEFLSQQRSLLVLDNCEQIVDEVAQLVDSLLLDCAHLRILATSREVLAVSGEAVLPLAPLGCPNPDGEPTLRTMLGSEAVALFVERARSAVPGFALTEQNVHAVARVCHRLDGLPLAIELAAARLRAISPSQIDDGLSDRYALLTQGRRGGPTRQQSLADCIGWSYELCTPAEQQLWARLSVFAGSFELRAAHDVCAEDLSAKECLDVLCALVDKSILIRSERDGTVRFQLLDAIREFGREHLADSVRDELSRRHADWYELFLADAEAGKFGSYQVQWLRRLIHEIPNIREMLQFSLLNRPARALRATTAMRGLWMTQGMFSEARRWLDLALSTTPTEPTAERIRALAATAVIATHRIDLAAAQDRIAEARRLLEVVDDPSARGHIDFADAYSALHRGEVQRALELNQRALDTTDDFEVQAEAMLLMGWINEASGDLEHALRWDQKALALTESAGEWVLRSYALWSVGTRHWRLGEPRRAELLLRQGLQLAGAINDPWNGAQCLESLAWVAGSEHRPRRAALLMAAAAAVSHAIGSPVLNIVSGLFHDACESHAREELGSAAYQAAWDEGNSLTFDEAVALALRQGDEESPAEAPAVGD